MRTGPAEGGGSQEEGGQKSSEAHAGDRKGEGGVGREGERGKVRVWLGFIHDVDAWQEEKRHTYVG